METDNISEQADEIEALKSIYENEWTEDDEIGSFTMKISKSVKLFITLHPDYPSKKPPRYEIMTSELTTDERNKLHKEFKTIYEDNMGGPILYQWIEKLKEYTIFKSKKNNEIEVVERITTKKMPNKSMLDHQRFLKEVVHGPTIEDRKSVFQGHVCAVSNEVDVRDFMEYLMENKKDCEDDGENHASKRVLHLLQLLNLENVMVVVSRWYGGIQLGPDRFKHITNAARRALVQAGFVK